MATQTNTDLEVFPKLWDLEARLVAMGDFILDDEAEPTTVEEHLFLDLDVQASIYAETIADLFLDSETLSVGSWVSAINTVRRTARDSERHQFGFGLVCDELRSGL